MASSSTSGQQQIETGNAFDGITPQACESSRALIKKVPCDVFINHRGCDVKHKLASTIHHTLSLVGLRAFLDVEELELGDSITAEIQEAMRSAGLHIAIFSVNYAKSAWCLAELSFMLKTGTPIIPVFYDVEPEVLRWVAQGKGIYAKAFSEHEKKGRYPPNKLEEWKRTLESVSNVSGYMLNSSNNDDEGRILDIIVNTVLKLTKKVPLEVAKHPVAMDEIVKDFEGRTLKCRDSEQHVQIVGIVGFGGSGKTTLATEIYNRKCSFINRSSFLSDVRDAAAARNGLHAKQKKLLEDLRVKTESFDSTKEGKGILANRLRSLCVLIVLDDVDHEDQLDVLLPPKDNLGWGSLIIVTSRDESVLTKSGITSVYKMRALPDFHAKRLFCWHAFRQPSPLEGFEDLVEKFLNVSKGLPLSLKVIGAQLYSRSKEYWNSQLCKIMKILPKDIKKTLRVSYDALDEEEQEIFLDTACFFNGENKNLAIDVWDGSGWSGLCSWETLLDKCLVELDEKECIKMHDHLRDLGREIAQTRSLSRFWFERQNINVQGGMLIRGMIAARNEYLYSESSGCSWPVKEYMEMMRSSSLSSGLQLLVVRENDFTQEFAELSRNLVWLRWFDSPHTNIPSWLSLENLRVLELCQTYLEALWEDDAHPPLQLRQLMITTGKKFKGFPKSIGCLKHLKKISLHVAHHLMLESCLLSLPEEFCLLQSLEHLDLEGCSKLLSLPPHFGDLIKLRHLNLSYCRDLRMFPISFKQLVNLEYLNLSNCIKLSLKSKDLLKNTKLKVLDVSYCKELQELPRHITNQANLRELGVSGTTSLRRLPANIGQLSKLETLTIGSPLLTSLPTSLGNLSSLTNIKISGCEKLKSLPESMGRLTLLQHINISDSGVKYLPKEFRQLINLQTLRIWSCPLRELAFRSGLGSSFSLRELRVIHLKDTQVSRVSLPGDCCPGLENLIVERCEYITEIKTLPTSLKEMDFSDCKMLNNMGFPEAFEQMTSLQRVSVVSCPIRELPFGRGSSSSLCNLRSIVLRCTAVSRISLLEDCCPSLEKFTVERCEYLMEIEILPTSLKEMDLSDCKMLNNMGFPEAFEQMTNLQSVRVVKCPIRESPFGRGSSSSLCNLRSIHLEATHLSMISISEDSCPSLESFQIENCEYLTEIDSMPTSLKSIIVGKCKMLKSIRGIGGLMNLQTLFIYSCPELDEMQSSAGLVSLKKFVLHNCEKMGKIKSLEHLTSLETLKVHTCWKAPGIESLEQMGRLRRVELIADNRSALQPCIQTIEIEKWPCDMVVCGRSVHNVWSKWPGDRRVCGLSVGVWSTLDSLSFPGLTVDSVLEIYHHGRYNETWGRLRCPTTHSDVAVTCFLITSRGSGKFINFLDPGCSEISIYFHMCYCSLILRRGTWVLIGVHTHCSPLSYREVFHHDNSGYDIERGISIVGEKGRVLQVLNQLFQLFET